MSEKERVWDTWEGGGVVRTVEREGLREIRYIVHVYSLVPRTLKMWERPGDEAKISWVVYTCIKGENKAERAHGE